MRYLALLLPVILAFVSACLLDSASNAETFSNQNNAQSPQTNLEITPLPTASPQPASGAVGPWSFPDGVNPLTGPNDEAIGLRFPDLSRAYDPDLLQKAMAAAESVGVPVHQGIYVGLAGPSLETNAERRYYRSTGGDAVGMSTVTETIAAVHAGMKVLGISAITNAATGGPDQQPDTIEDVLANAAISGRKMDALLQRLIPEV